MATKEELLQAAQDAKDQPKIDAAYSAALTSTEEKPAPPPLPKPAPKPAPMPKPKKMASGGSASSRADGCALRGKTRA
jgi:hypothetical protein